MHSGGGGILVSETLTFAPADGPQVAIFPSFRRGTCHRRPCCASPSDLQAAGHLYNLPPSSSLFCRRVPRRRRSQRVTGGKNGAGQAKVEGKMEDWRNEKGKNERYNFEKRKFCLYFWRETFSVDNKRHRYRKKSNFTLLRSLALRQYTSVPPTTELALMH